ncbi:MAG TPA: histidine kinase [Chitinophagaceae bacterium]|nr:histidine kinase [Chitinophagaceae bacterium]
MNMQWHEFIFSEQRKHKLLRHFVFWSAWLLFFLICFILFNNLTPASGMANAGNMVNPFNMTPGDHLLLKTFLLVLLYALACYPLIYFILPEIIKRKWLKAIAYFISLCSLLYVATYFLFWNVFSFIDSSSGSSKTNYSVAGFWPALNLGLMNFAKVATAAAIIKYLKYWWMKQKEGQRLAKEKINAELQLLKAQVHPDFLFKTLNNIYTHALSSSPRTSGMLLKLSDLLSYMLYECDNPLVPLEKEIAMMKEYMQLEKIRHNDEPEMEVNIKGDLSGQMIAPFLLLPFIENSFKHCAQMTEQFWINMDIKIEGNHFTMKLTNGIPEQAGDQSLMPANGLANVQKRLTLLYPGNHELKMTMEQEMYIVLLSIRLDDSMITVDEEINPETIRNNEDMTTILKYASD